MNKPLQPPVSATQLLMFTITFLILIFFATILNQVGAPAIFLAILMMAFVVGMYLYAGISNKTLQYRVYENVGGNASPVFVGLAISSGLISATFFVLLPGITYFGGLDFIAIFHGVLLGLGMIAIMFVGRRLRSEQTNSERTQASTVGDKSLTAIMLVFTLVPSFLLLLVQLSVLETVVSGFFALSAGAGAKLAMIVTAGCLCIGGRKTLSMARVFAFPIILIAILAPSIWVSYQLVGNPVPQISFGGGAIQAIAELDSELLAANLATEEEIFDITQESGQLIGFNYFASMLCIAFGVAAMPHLLQHLADVPTNEAKRKSILWAMAFTFLFLSTIPALTMFAKFDIYTALLGLDLAKLEAEAGWLFAISGGGALPLITICGELIASQTEAIAACGRGGGFFLTLGDIGINPELLLLAFSSLHQLPVLIAVLVATGALVAILSTLDGLIMVMARSIMRDGYHKILHPKAPEAKRLLVFRLAIVLVSALGLIGLEFTHVAPLFMFEATFVLVAATLFPIMLIQSWFKSVSAAALVFGVLMGFATSCLLLYLVRLGPDLIAASGDETVIAIPALTNQLHPLSIGILGLIVTAAAAALLEWQMRARKEKRKKEAPNVDVRPGTI